MTEQSTDTGSTNTDTGAAIGTEVLESGGSPEGFYASENTPETNAPEEISYTYAPEGVQVDAELMGAVAPVLRELGLNQEQASKLFDAYTAVANQRAGADDVATAQAQWEDQLKKDPEFGGDNFAQNAAQVRQFLMATVPDPIKNELVTALQDTGLGSHPAMIKYFHALSKKFPTGEDQPFNARSRASNQKSAAERMYGTQ